MVTDFAARFDRMDTPELPLYERIKRLLRDLIAGGELAPGERIPSEAALVRMLGASRMTVNRAMRELAAEGYLSRSMGVGTFVARNTPAMPLFEIRSIAEDIRRSGGTYGVRVHLLREEPAPEAVAREMEIPEGEPLFHSVLVHRDRGVPIQLEDRYVLPAFAPAYLAQDFAAVTPAEFLMGVAPAAEVEHTLEARMPDRAARARLAMGAGEPCLILYRKTWACGRVVTWSRFSHPGSRYRIGGRFRPRPPGVDPLAGTAVEP